MCIRDSHYTSRRIGTKFGVTPLLLGGYAAICGMDPTDVSCADRVLAAIYRHGRVTVADLAVELELSEEVVLEACALLLGWGSIAPWYEEGEKPSPSYYPTKYQTLPRDAAGYTTFDGRRFDREHATTEGDVWELPCGGRQRWCNPPRLAAGSDTCRLYTSPLPGRIRCLYRRAAIA